ncbi:MAG: hypothetical protein WEE89_02660 [Gemmatimonadota bacterium]
MRIVLNQPIWIRLRGSSGDPAVDRAEDGEGSRLLAGTGRVERYNAGEDDETAALGGFNGNDHVAAAKEVGECNSLEPKADGVDDLGCCGEGSASGGSDAADG